MISCESAGHQLDIICWSNSLEVVHTSRQVAPTDADSLIDPGLRGSLYVRALCRNLYIPFSTILCEWPCDPLRGALLVSASIAILGSSCIYSRNLQRTCPYLLLPTNSKYKPPSLVWLPKRQWIGSDCFTDPRARVPTAPDLIVRGVACRYPVPHGSLCQKSQAGTGYRMGAYLMAG